MSVALFGITNQGLNLFVNLLVLFAIALWIALIAWTYFDARRRIGDGFLVGCATAASLFPYVGTAVYAILRPPEFLEDARERELEIRAAELRVRQLEEQSCPNCGHPVERTYLRCPECSARLKDPCESCGKPIDPRWRLCPYCETPQRTAPPARAPERARRAARPTRAEPSDGRREPGAAKRPPPQRPAPQRAVRSSGSRSATKQSAATAKQRKPAPGRAGQPSPPSRESPGDEQRRPAPAS